jgi:hypothetical protein
MNCEPSGSRRFWWMPSGVAMPCHNIPDEDRVIGPSAIDQVAEPRTELIWRGRATERAALPIARGIAKGGQGPLGDVIPPCPRTPCNTHLRSCSTCGCESCSRGWGNTVPRRYPRAPPGTNPALRNRRPRWGRRDGASRCPPRFRAARCASARSRGGEGPGQLAITGRFGPGGPTRSSWSFSLTFSLTSTRFWPIRRFERLSRL